jgi:thiol:disulfide interchange protein
MMKNVARGVIGLVLTAVATWLANRIVDQVFGPDEPEPQRG